MRKQRKKLKGPKTLLKNDQKRLTLKKTVKNEKKGVHRLRIGQLTRKTERKFEKTLRKHKNALKTPKKRPKTTNFAKTR